MMIAYARHASACERSQEKLKVFVAKAQSEGWERRARVVEGECFVFSELLPSHTQQSYLCRRKHKSDVHQIDNATGRAYSLFIADQYS